MFNVFLINLSTNEGKEGKVVSAERRERMKAYVSLSRLLTWQHF